ncbi:NAD(P)/FAD-dependent oxidoreductase [Nocardia salmonicida]|uniref:NAD(P)/FAD-dependent oxidoreductase n=1 Tax=Nocardia salmonicida TaxID=53431 RepID=UPI00371C7BC7
MSKNPIQPALIQQVTRDGRRTHVFFWTELCIAAGVSVVGNATQAVLHEYALGGLYIPSDGAADPTAVTNALTDAAERDGAHFLWKTRVHDLEIEQGTVSGVCVGEDGQVLRAEHVVLAAGIWRPALARHAGIWLPMVSVEHPYIYTTELPDLDNSIIDEPIVRYPDQGVYTRRHGRRYGLGSYSHAPLPVDPTAALASAEYPFRETEFGDTIAKAMDVGAAAPCSDAHIYIYTCLHTSLSGRMSELS